MEDIAMKKVLAFLAFAAAMNIPAAKADTSFLDDSASFKIAKSVKLGYGDYSSSFVQGKGVKKMDFNSCSSDGQCRLTQKCVDGKCEDVCTPSPCSGETPSCEAANHTASCKCTDTSCGTGKQCVDGQCETCTTGSKCGCDGSKVIDSAGYCVCPSSISCPAGQRVGDDCSCENCLEYDTRDNKCGCPGNTVPDGSGGCVGSDPCENVTCDGGKVCSEGVCGCPSGTVWYSNQCRTVGCPSAYSDHYDMMKNGSDCTLSPNGEVMSTGSGSYTLCASCTAKSCPTGTTAADKLQNCKTTKESGSYSGSVPCVECTRCDTGYYLFMGKCLKCVNANCDGTDSPTCSEGYENGSISTDATQYVCTKAENCSCTSAKSGSLSGTLTSDNKVSLSNLCTKMPSGAAGCSYQPIGTYIQLNSAQSSVTSVGDTRISSCSVSSGKITCKHTYEPGVTFTVKVTCPSGYCSSNGICVKEVSCNVERCASCVCGRSDLCKSCESGWTGVKNSLGGESGYLSCDCKNSSYENGKWLAGACY